MDVIYERCNQPVQCFSDIIIIIIIAPCGTYQSYSIGLRHCEMHYG